MSSDQGPESMLISNSRWLYTLFAEIASWGRKRRKTEAMPPMFQWQAPA